MPVSRTLGAVYASFGLIFGLAGFFEPGTWTQRLSLILTMGSFGVILIVLGGGRTFKVIYDDDDPSKLLREEQVAPGADEQGPTDGLMGAGYVEKVLTRLLG